MYILLFKSVDKDETIANVLFNCYSNHKKDNNKNKCHICYTSSQKLMYIFAQELK